MKSAKETIAFLRAQAKLCREEARAAARNRWYAQATESTTQAETYEFLIRWIRGDGDT